MAITINAALELEKLINSRITELKNLRANSTHSVHAHYVDTDKKVTISTPEYDIKLIDKEINRLSRDLRLLKAAIKETNAKTEVIGCKITSIEDYDLGEMKEFNK